MEHPFFGLVGLSGHRLLRADQPVRHAARLQGVRRRAATRTGIGVILDWVPGHFPKDAHGLARFDGTALYEHAEPAAGGASRLGHADLQLRPQRGPQLPARQRALLARRVPHRRPARGRGRVDALPRLLASGPGEWVPNKFGGRENIDAIDFLRELNALTHGEHPGSIMIAEESTAFPGRDAPDLSRRPRASPTSGTWAG